MNTDKQRIAIAEACGWTREYAQVPTWNASLDSYKGGYEPVQTLLFTRLGKRVLARGLPDYLNDLNTMHEAEKSLDDVTQRGDYWDYLSSLTHEGFEMCHASAAQRAEAFLRTVGKWEEDK